MQNWPWIEQSDTTTVLLQVSIQTAHFYSITAGNVGNNHNISDIHWRLVAILKICKLRKMLKDDKVSLGFMIRNISRTIFHTKMLVIPYFQVHPNIPHILPDYSPFFMRSIRCLLCGSFYKSILDKSKINVFKLNLFQKSVKSIFLVLLSIIS